MTSLFITAATIHSMDCDCSACEPIAHADPHHPGAQAKAKLAIAAAIVGTVIAFAIDPAGAFEALRATVAL